MLLIELDFCNLQFLILTTIYIIDLNVHSVKKCQKCMCSFGQNLKLRSAKTIQDALLTFNSYGWNWIKSKLNYNY